MNMANNEKSQTDKINFLTWYRNGCTSNTQQQANEMFRRLSFAKKRSLRKEYKSLLDMIAEKRSSNTK